MPCSWSNKNESSRKKLIYIGFLYQIFVERKYKLSDRTGIRLCWLLLNIWLTSSGLCFQVLIRSTSDDWVTHEDAYCTFVSNGLKAPAVTVLYDTFSFRLALPPQSRRLVFCVCYRCGESEYWDSNSGKNYVLLKKSTPHTHTPLVNPVDELTAKVSAERLVAPLHQSSLLLFITSAAPTFFLKELSHDLILWIEPLNMRF